MYWFRQIRCSCFITWVALWQSLWPRLCEVCWRVSRRKVGMHLTRWWTRRWRGVREWQVWICGNAWTLLMCGRNGGVHHSSYSFWLNRAEADDPLGCWLGELSMWFEPSASEYGMDTCNCACVDDTVEGSWFCKLPEGGDEATDGAKLDGVEKSEHCSGVMEVSMPIRRTRSIWWCRWREGRHA